MSVPQVLQYQEQRILTQVASSTIDVSMNSYEGGLYRDAIRTGEFGARPDSLAPWHRQNDPGLHRYGHGRVIIDRMAAAYLRNNHVRYDLADLLVMGLALSQDRLWMALCSCYNATRDIAAQERGNGGPNGRWAREALALIRPSNDPYSTDRGGPAYHFFGIGVFMMGAGPTVTSVAAGMQQWVPGTNNADRFKHHELGNWAVSFWGNWLVGIVRRQGNARLREQVGDTIQFWRRVFTGE
ncbi:MAG: hypothetical protein R3B70_05025 [Polyangiaceae bacterium]